MTDSTEQNTTHESSFSGLVDIGGYRLSASVTGAGSPPVVYLSGLWVDAPGDVYDVDPGDEWHQVPGLLTETTTTVLYDRAGVGRSDPAPEDGRAGGAMASAAELCRLLAALGVTSPVVVVGQSIGAVVAEGFARAYPELTAGLVSVDGTPHGFHSVAGGVTERVEGRGGRVFDHLRDVAPAERHPEPLHTPGAVLTSSVGRWLSLPPERHVYQVSLAELDELWQRWQRDTATRLHAP